MMAVGQLASHWNIPVMGWISTDQKLGDKKVYSTLVRTYAPVNKLGKKAIIMVAECSGPQIKVSWGGGGRDQEFGFLTILF